MKRLSILCIALAAAGCGPQPDRVLFVTSSEIGIGVDPALGTANIGYDRNELVVGPAYPETGGVPPVYARIDTGGSVFDSKVRQLYATGEAAVQATSESPRKIEKDELHGMRRIMVFGTSTNFGFNVAFTDAQALPAVNFGYKRKEFSLLPLRPEQPTEENPDLYGSVIAAINIDLEAPDLAGTGLTSTQFIATGEAASYLGREQKGLFLQTARGALGAAVNVKSELDWEPYCKAFANQSTGDAAKWAGVKTATGFDLATECIAEEKSAAKLAAIKVAAAEAGIVP